jgi:hypothetical protein
MASLNAEDKLIVHTPASKIEWPARYADLCARMGMSLEVWQMDRVLNLHVGGRMDLEGASVLDCVLGAVGGVHLDVHWTDLVGGVCAAQP